MAVVAGHPLVLFFDVTGLSAVGVAGPSSFVGDVCPDGVCCCSCRTRSSSPEGVTGSDDRLTAPVAAAVPSAAVVGLPSKEVLEALTDLDFSDPDAGIVS